MKSKIKFKAWLKDEKKIVKVSELRDIDTDIKSDQNVIYFDFEKQEYCNKGFDEVELIQYTGLKDKNGVEIFEGDIVECDEKIAVVKYGYHNCGCCYDVYGFALVDNHNKISSLYFDYCKVIGNIYENPELLENKDA